MRTEGQRRSSNIEDRRGQRGARRGGGGVFALLPFLFRLMFSRLGRRFVLPLVIVAVVGFVFFPGPTQAILNQIIAMSTGGSLAPPAEPLPEAERERLEATTSVALASTEDVWDRLFANDGLSYREPTLVLYSGGTTTACGYGSSAAGPFYCPGDQKLYIDLRFFSEMGRKLNAPGDFAQAYVVAHEVGHHVQELTGVLDWAAREKQRAGGQSAAANQVQVRVELMADCLAGVWAHHARQIIEPGDLDEAIGAAEAVGDDTLQRRSQGRVVPDAFTHGTAAQRKRWFETGFDGGDADACETRSIAYSQL